MGIDLETYDGKNEISLDFGRSPFSSKSFSSSGCIIGKILQQNSPRAHHTHNVFSPKFSEIIHFKNIASLLKEFIKGVKCK